mgnify:CR=1 FL=1
MDKKIRIGVVGTGRGKTFMHPGPELGMKLMAICDRNEKKLAICKSKYDNEDKSVELYTDYDEMLEKRKKFIEIYNKILYYR